MRTFTSLGFCLTLLCLLSSNANATHIMGASITWDNIGKDSFEVKLKVYRDCTGISLGKPDLKVGCNNGPIQNVNKTLLSYNNGPPNASNNDPREVTPVCDKYGKQCADNRSGGNLIGSLGYGMEEHTTTYLVDLSNTNCCKVKFSYSECCRSNSITTGLSGDLYYVESWMNRCKAPANNAPEFRQLPLMLLCKGSTYKGNQGAFDKDTTNKGTPSDSLFFQFTKPLGRGPNNAIAYNGPYSYKKPLRFKGFPNTALPGSSGFRLDSLTGGMAFQPAKKQVTVFKIKVKEYRDINGKPTLIGEYSRDVQVFIKNCSPNNAPKITGMNCSSRTRASACEGDSFQAKFCTSDPNAKDTVKLLRFNPGDLPGSPQFAIKDTTAQFPEGKLNWDIPQDAGSPKAYKFSLFAEDDHCPRPGEVAKTYRVKVNPRPAKPQYSIKPLSCGKYRFLTSVASANTKLSVMIDGNQYQQDTFTFNPQLNKDYPVKITASRKTCKNSIRDTVRVDSQFVVDIGNDTTICSGDDLSVKPSVVFNNGPVSYTWQDSISKQNRIFKDIRQDTVIRVEAKDNSCKATDSIKVTVDSFSQRVQTIPDTSICKAGNRLVAYADTSVSQYQWSTGSTADSAVIEKGGSYNVKLTNKRGCTGVDAFSVRERLDTNIVPDSAGFCPGKKVSLTAKAGNPNATYQWSNNKTGETIKVGKKGNYRVTALLNNTCQSTDTIHVSKLTKPVAGLRADTSICRTDSIQLAAKKGYSSYSWSNGDTSRSIWASTQKQYTVTVTNARGCTNTDTVQVTTLNDCVWPGDANNDGVANNLDILDIGVKYNTSGKTRNNQGTQWDAYKSNDWTDTFNSGLNTKFADCDGNGMVQTSDTLAVSQNYGQTHNKRGLEGDLEDGGTPLSLMLKQDNLEPGDQAEVMVKLGKQSNEAQNFYGIAANLKFSGKVIEVKQLRVSGQGTWLQSGDPNFITFGKVFSQTGRIELAGTRTDQQGVSGQGTALKLILPLQADTKGDTLQVSVQGEYLIGPNGEPITYDTGQTEVKQAITKSTGRTEHSRLSQHIQTYPNPTSGQLHVKVEQIEPERARLLNARGQTMRSFDLTKGSNRLSVDRLPAGPYHLMIRTAEGLVQHTVVVR